MVDTFLTERADRPDADLDLEYGGPGWPEVRATAVLAVRTRFAATRPLGDVVRLIAVLGLLAQLAMAVPGLAQVLHPTALASPATLTDLGIAVGLASAAVTMAPIVLLLAGHRAAARGAVVLALVPGAVGLARSLPGQLTMLQVALRLDAWVPATAALVIGTGAFVVASTVIGLRGIPVSAARGVSAA